MKIIKRSAGRSATAAAAYRGGLEISDERTGERHNYENRGGVLSHDMMAPSRAPEWAKGANSLWNAVEEKENRVNSQLARENVVALPEELSLEQNRSLIQGFVQDAYIKRGMAAQVNIHGPAAEGDERNIHAHVLLTMRGLTRDGWKEKKARNWNEKQTLQEWRTLWANHVNHALERAGFAERVTEKSFKDLGLDKVPTQHLGPAATEIKRRGEKSRIAEENAVIEFQNRRMEALKTQRQIMQQAIAREAKRIAEERAKAMQREERYREEREKKIKKMEWGIDMPDSKKCDSVSGNYWAQQDEQRQFARRELLARGPGFWAQVDKEFAAEERDIKASYNITELAKHYAEARRRAFGLDTVNGRFSGEHAQALEEARVLEENLKNAKWRQEEALGRLNAERDYLRTAREERAASLMNTKLNAQFEAQREKGEIEQPDVAIEQDNAGYSVEDSPEQEQPDHSRSQEPEQDYGMER